jgi:hypothetical protein
MHLVSNKQQKQSDLLQKLQLTWILPIKNSGYRNILTNNIFFPTWVVEGIFWVDIKILEQLQQNSFLNM